MKHALGRSTNMTVFTNTTARTLHGSTCTTAFLKRETIKPLVAYSEIPIPIPKTGSYNNFHHVNPR